MAVGKPAGGAKPARPLSPHLQIYTPIINMVQSILHRMTGAALYFGSLLLTWWLVAAAVGPDTFHFVNSVFGSLPGRIVLFGYTWALLHHAIGGIRHLIWDTGRGHDVDSIDKMSWWSVYASVGLTLLIWGYVYSAYGRAI